MQGVLKYDLPEDEALFKIAVHALDWRGVVCELERALRDWNKHGHQFKTADEALEAVFGLLWEELEARGLLLDEG